MRVGRFKGADLTVNSLFLLMCLVYLIFFPIETLVIVIVLLCHEIAHVATAALCRFKLLEIELFPFGGQITAEKFWGIEPRKEMLVAAAGPAVSLFLGGVIFIMKGNAGETTFSFFVHFSLFMGLFNLLPVLPLDGGRICTAYLASKIGPRRAAKIGARFGMLTALIMLVLGMVATIKDWRALTLVIAAAFLGYKAYQELKLEPYGFTLFLIHKRTLLKENGLLPLLPIAAGCSTLVIRVLERIRSGQYLVLAVIGDNGELLGFLSERMMIEGYLRRGSRLKVGDLLGVGAAESWNGPGNEN